MPHRNDCKHAFFLGELGLGTGHIDDLELNWLEKELGLAPKDYTNLIPWSRDLTNAFWVTADGVTTFDQDGIYGEPNAASRIVDNTNTAITEVNMAAPLVIPDKLCTLRIIFKRQASGVSEGYGAFIAIPGADYAVGMSWSTLQAIGFNDDVNYEIRPFYQDWYQFIMYNIDRGTAFDVAFYPAITAELARLVSPDVSLLGELVIGNVELWQDLPNNVISSLPPVYSDGTPGTISLSEVDVVNDLWVALFAQDLTADLQTPTGDFNTDAYAWLLLKGAAPAALPDMWQDFFCTNAAPPPPLNAVTHLGDFVTFEGAQLTYTP